VENKFMPEKIKPENSNTEGRDALANQIIKGIEEGRKAEETQVEAGKITESNVISLDDLIKRDDQRNKENKEAPNN